MKLKTVMNHFRPIACSTLTGRVFFGGAFFMLDTVGLPLGEQILVLDRMNDDPTLAAPKAAISIPDFVREARRAGWADRFIAGVLKETFMFLGRHDEGLKVIHAAGLAASQD